jgi:hypothetical protein
MGEAGLYALSTSWDEAPGIWWDYYQVYNRAGLTPPCSSIACQQIGRQQAESRVYSQSLVSYWSHVWYILIAWLPIGQYSTGGVVHPGVCPLHKTCGSEYSQSLASYWSSYWSIQYMYDRVV